MSALGPGEIRARRRPFVVLALTVVRLFSGFLLAYPLAALIAQSGVGLRAEGDRALFEGGGYLLLELVRLEGQSLLAALRGLMPVFVLGLGITAACNAALLVALNERERLLPRSWLASAWARLPAISLLGAGTLLGQLALIVVGVIATGALPEPLARPVLFTGGQAAVWLLVALAAGALGGYADLVRAALVRYDLGLRVALTRAFRTAQGQPVSAYFGWFPYACGFLLAAYAAAQLSGLCDVSRPGAWRVAGVFVLHQLVVLVSVAARAAWFARALRLVAAAPE